MTQYKLFVFATVVAAAVADEGMQLSANWYKGGKSSMCQEMVTGRSGTPYHTCPGKGVFHENPKRCCRDGACCEIRECTKGPTQYGPCAVNDMRDAFKELEDGLIPHGLPPSGASSSMRDTLLFNGMRGWKDVPKARFMKFPEALEWRRALVPSVRTKKGFEVELDCVRGGAGDMCDHFVFMYSCPPCEFADGGNLVADLLADGFMPHRCGTVFDLDNTVQSELHNVVIYHKQTPAGQYDTITANELLEFAWYALSPASSFCPAYDDDAACTANSECRWTGDGCQASWCPARPRGPWAGGPPKCQVCPFDTEEARYIPELRM